MQKVAELKDVCEGMKLEEIWDGAKSKGEVYKAKQQLREYFQEKVRAWCSRDQLKRIPVYISFKPKKKVRGRYFEGKKGSGSIVIYPIVLHKYPAESAQDISVRSVNDMESTLEHEYVHHLRKDVPHGSAFNKELEKIRRRNRAKT